MTSTRTRDPRPPPPVLVFVVPNPCVDFLYIKVLPTLPCENISNIPSTFLPMEKISFKLSFKIVSLCDSENPEWKCISSPFLRTPFPSKCCHCFQWQHQLQCCPTKTYVSPLRECLSHPRKTPLTIFLHPPGLPNFSVETSSLLWIDKERVTDNTCKWVSVWCKTKKLKLRNLHVWYDLCYSGNWNT